MSQIEIEVSCQEFQWGLGCSITIWYWSYFI